METKLLQQYLDHSAQKYPSFAAVNDDRRELSYDDLSRFSNQLAHGLLSLGVNPQDRVAICMKRSTYCIGAMLGTLKADAIYVPVSSRSPEKRFAGIVRDCMPKVYICDKSTVDKVERLRDELGYEIQVVVLSEGDVGGTHAIGLGDVLNRDDSIPVYRNGRDDIAYILYTSGSTGSPKGVMVSHLNVISYIEWAVEEFEITSKDNILGTAPFSFDMSTFDIYATLKTGAGLYVAPEEYLLFPAKLMSFIEKHEVTLWKGISSLLMYLARTGALEKKRIPTLQRILFGGESLPTKHLINWMLTYPDKSFYNVYGPTEATGISTCYPVREIPKHHEEAIPIGYPSKDTEVVLIDQNNAHVEAGEVGELCIKGAGLSRGYWEDEQKSKCVFVVNPLTNSPGDIVFKTGDLATVGEDGALIYLGRKDDQVKVMGYRIELGEVENAIISINGVHDASVILADDEYSGVQEIVAFLEVEKGIRISDISRQLKASIPYYMQPKKLLKLPCIFRTERGKKSKAALYEYYHSLKR